LALICKNYVKCEIFTDNGLTDGDGQIKSVK